MNEFYKTIALKVKLDETSLKNTRSTLNALVHSKEFSSKEADRLMKDLKRLEKTSAMIDELQQDLKTIQKLDTADAKKAEASIKAKIKELGGIPEDEQKKADERQAKLQGMLKGVATKFLQGLKQTFDDALDELKSMGEYSRMTNASIRELKLGYGFSSSQAYGFSQATSMLGIESMEDLMWANSQQLTQFRRLFEKYTEYYEETMTPEYIEKQLEYQIAMQEFKMDLQHTVIDFFMNNKDAIMTLMDTGMSFMEGVISMLGWLVNFFDGNRARSENDRRRETQSILSAYTSNTKNTSVNQTNNFNNVSQADQTWLQNASQLAFKQVIDVYNRG